MSEYYPIIFFVGGAQGVILTVFLFNQKKNLLAYRILGSLTLCWGIILVAFGLQFEGFFADHPHFLGTFSRIIFLIFPLLFLNVKYLVYKHNRFNRIDWLHFIPFILSILFYLDFYSQAAEEKLILLQSNSGYHYVIDLIGEEVLVVQGIAYSILALLLLSRYRREIMNYMSNTEKVLITVMVRGIIILLISWVIGSIAVNLAIFNIDVSFDLFILVYLLIVIVIYSISYYAIRSPEIFKLDWEVMHPSIIPSKDEHGGDTGSGNVSIQPNDLNLENLNNKLVNYIEGNKPYLEPDLSLPDLASQLDISRNQLSALINQKQQKNFYEFINSYRIDEVKNLMNDPDKQNLKIISLAYDAGFNSKTSFNRIFKQITNMTPSQYQKTIVASQ